MIFPTPQRNFAASLVDRHHRKSSEGAWGNHFPPHPFLIPCGRGDEKEPRFGWLDLLVLVGLLALFGWLAWRANTFLVYNWNWAIVPSLFFRNDPETGALIPHLLSQGLFTTLRLTFYARSPLPSSAS